MFSKRRLFDETLHCCIVCLLLTIGTIPCWGSILQYWSCLCQCNSQLPNELLACNLSGQKTAQPVPRSRSQEFCRRKPQNMLFSPTISPNFFPPLSLFGVSSPHTQLHDPKTSVSKCGKPARKKPDMNVRSFTTNGRWGLGWEVRSDQNECKHFPSY